MKQKFYSARGRYQLRTDLRSRPSTTPATSSTPDFRLNFLQATLSSKQFSAGVLDYESAEQLRDLRQDTEATHVIQRRGDKVICIPLVSGVATLGEPQVFQTDEAPDLVRKLLRQSLLRFIWARNYTVTEFDPPTFVVRQAHRDFIAGAVGPQQAGCVDWLHGFPQYSLSARALHVRQGPSLIGVQVDVHTRYEIDCTVEELLARGLNVVGRYVRIQRTSDGPVNVHRDVTTQRKLAGRVYDVSNGWLFLDDAPDVDKVQASEAWLEARLENIEDCLQVAGLNDVGTILRQLRETTFHFMGAKGRLDRINEIASLLGSQKALILASDLSCTIGEALSPHRGTDVGAYRQFPKPYFVFDAARSKTDTWHNRGLQEHGPFDTESFATKHPRVAIVAPREYQGDVEVFLRKFRDGVPKSKVFLQGFVRKYHLNACTFEFELFDPGARPAVDYREACLRALRADLKPDMAFVIIEERHRQLHGDDDPYLVSKSTFMSQGVPVQEIEIETIQVPPRLENSIQYALDNIGLAAYAKLGGIPFVMAATSGLAHELVIGIGSATLRDGRLTGVERVVGITTVFSADGNYLLYNSSREVDFEDYPDELLSTLRVAVDQIRLRNAWQPGDSIRLIFHVFKPLKDVEAQAVKRLVSGLADQFKVEFAFLHVSEDHDWLLFDKASLGVKDWAIADQHLRGRMKGEYVPERGYAVPLSKSEILLSVTGPSQLKSPLHGAPRPLVLHLHRESTFTSLEYLAGQLYRFTSLSWRTFLPGSQPVTILYSERIATLLGNLRHVRNWNPDVLATTLRGSRWFL